LAAASFVLQVVANDVNKLPHQWAVSETSAFGKRNESSGHRVAVIQIQASRVK